MARLDNAAVTAAIEVGAGADVLSLTTAGESLMVGTSLRSRGMYYTEYIDEVEREIESRGGVPEGASERVVFDRSARELALRQVRERPFDVFVMACRYKVSALWGSPGWWWPGFWRLS